MLARFGRSWRALCFASPVALPVALPNALPNALHIALKIALHILLWIAVLPAGSAAAQATVPAAAIETPHPRWQVLHCGVSRGVLYLTYTDGGRAFITPAQPNAAVRRACDRAGHPVDDRAPVRTPHALPPVTVSPPGGLGSAPPIAGAPLPGRSEPGITAQALGHTLGIDGRNDNDAALHCLITFSWMADGDTLPRADSAQVTLPPHQVGRVVTRSAPQGGVRFVDPPRWSCSAGP